MITISTVAQKDAEQAYQEFFLEEFRSRRLGTVGQWFGEAAPVLGLSQPVSLKTFTNLVNGLNPDGDKRILQDGDNPNRTALWRIEYDGSQSLSVLWAIAPASWRTRVEEVHVNAARQIIRQINAEFAVRTWLRSSSAATFNRPHLLATCFSYGTTYDQTPHLKATAFVLAHGFIRDGSVCKLDTYDIKTKEAQLSRLHDSELQSHCWNSLRLVKAEPFIRELRIAGVPQELVRKFFFDPAFTRDSRVAQNSKPLEKADLFAKWRVQAEGFGWGVREAESLLRESKREKYWHDLKMDFRSKVRGAAKSFITWKDSWKPKTEQHEQPKQEQTSERERHRHSH